ncbi:hypothetical protein LK490_23670, partial [Blautia sp. MSK22_86]|uniref:hypothetical protein n=1 Tax=Blautia sp. MSK22_86 TaxID=2884906 RepID=UPI001D11D8E6
MNDVWNIGDATGINNGDERKYSEGSLDEAKKEISEKLHIAVPEFYYIPSGMVYSKFMVFDETQMA